MGRASENHMTDISQTRSLTFVSVFFSSTFMAIILRKPFPYTRKKCKFLTTAIDTTCSVEQLLYLFMVLDLLLRFVVVCNIRA